VRKYITQLFCAGYLLTEVFWFLNKAEDAAYTGYLFNTVFVEFIASSALIGFSVYVGGGTKKPGNFKF